MKESNPTEFRIVFDGEMPPESKMELERALHRTTLDHLARMDLLPVAAASRLPELKLHPEWFGIWIRRGHALDLGRIKEQMQNRLGR